jgi:hypothetical protein
VTFKKIPGALFKKSAHSGIFYDLQLKFAIKKAFIHHKPKNNFRPNPSTTMGQKIESLTKKFFLLKNIF